MYEKNHLLLCQSFVLSQKRKHGAIPFKRHRHSHYYPYSSSLIAIQEYHLFGWMRIIIAWIGAANVFLTTVFLSSFAWYDCFNAKQHKYN